MLPNQPDIEKERNETRLEQIGEQLVSFLEQCFLSPSLKYDKIWVTSSPKENQCRASWTFSRRTNVQGTLASWKLQTVRCRPNRARMLSTSDLMLAPSSTSTSVFTNKFAKTTRRSTLALKSWRRCTHPHNKPFQSLPSCWTRIWRTKWQPVCTTNYLRTASKWANIS